MTESEEEKSSLTRREQQRKEDLKKLEPTSEEGGLWAWIETADTPIRTILKRLNKITKNKFPNYKLRTVSSCSGHITPGGSLLVENYAPTISESHEPHIMFFTRNSVHRLEMAEYLRKIFEQAVINLNGRFGRHVMSLDVDTEWVSSQSFVNGVYGTVVEEKLARRHPSRKTFAINFNFPLTEMQDAFPILSGFWTEVEKTTTEIDSLNLPSQFKPEDFLRSAKD